MKTLVIHPHDPTTDFLSEIYAGRDWTVIRENVSRKVLTDAIKEHDHIIMLGHGTPYGLLGFERMYIDSLYIYLLKEKECTCIWCNADEFVQKYKLKGLHTGMFISEVGEAYDFCVPATLKEIWNSNRMFASAVRKALISEEPLSVLKAMYEETNDLTMFNKERMYLND